MDKRATLILTLSDISYHMNSMILAEICYLSHFDSLDKILAYAGISSYTYQSDLLLLVKDVFIIFHHFFPDCPVSHALSHGE